MKVRLWTYWPADGQLYAPGDEIDVSPAEWVAMRAAGAGGDVIHEQAVEVATVAVRERAVRRRKRPR